MRPLRILVVLLCASTLALAASGCGGGGGGASYSGAEPEVWAATVCGALSEWAQGLQADSKRLGTELAGATRIAIVKTKFVGFLKNAERSSVTMLEKIGRAGPPAVKDGAAIQQQLVSGLEQARSSFTRAIAKAKKLSTTNPQAFSSGVSALGQDVERELTATGDEFSNLEDKYDDDTLNEATSKEPACNNISGSS